MDISSEIKPKKSASKLIAVVLGASVLAGAAGTWLVRENNAAQQLASSQKAEVKSGDMNLKVPGYGRLKSAVERFLASPLAATVEEINVRPGESVTKDTVVIRLSNSEIASTVAAARAKLAEAKFSLKQRVTEQSNELTARKVDLAELEGNFTNAKFRVDAWRNVYELGGISALNYKTNEFEVQKLEKIIKLRKEQLHELQMRHADDIESRKELAKQLEISLSVQLDMLEALQVKARMDGVMKSLDVVPGQAVSVGHRLAEIGSKGSLAAELLVAQRDASSISIGQEAVINAGGETIKGKVQRIDPIVVDGRVRVELVLQQPLPANAKPELAVQGNIAVGALRNTLFIAQPPRITANSKREMSVLARDTGKTALRMVRFGAVSDGNIQILEGVKAGDTVLIANDESNQD